MKKILWISILMGLSSPVLAGTNPPQQAQQLQYQQLAPNSQDPAPMHEYMQKYDNLHILDGKRPHDPNLIQLALLLDTSNSMNGLINQAKSQLWMIVNELAHAHKDAKSIRLEVALYEYGNDRLSLNSGYIRQVTAFSEDLDLLSEALFSLQTNGGSEYCGHVIGASLNGLKWNTAQESLKMIYIAGNEAFNQGEVHFKTTCSLAARRNVIINTIHCGDYQTGIRSFWQQGASLGKGRYFSIDSDRVTAGIASPYDDELIALNASINQSYVPYGHAGKKNLMRQSQQDSNAAMVSKATSASRVSSKGSSLYKSSSWDLVDAVAEEKISIKEVKREQLSEELQDKTDAELSAYVKEKKQERDKIKQKVSQLSEKRAAFIQAKRKENTQTQSLGSAIEESLHQQAKQQGFVFQ